MRATVRVGVTGFILSAGTILGSSATAATIFVNPDGLVGGCPLRAAIQAANTDTASPSCTAGSGTDTLVLQQYNDRPYFTPTNLSGNDEDNNSSGDLDITSSIIIQGENPAQSIIVGPSLDRAIDVRGSGSLTLNDVTVIGGSLLGVSGEYGGVIRKGADATLTINRSVLRDGKSDRGGAVYASGTGVLTLDKVSIFGNFATYGGGVMLAQASGIEAVLNNLTLSGNTATISGGGLYASSWFRLRNSTVARNRSGAGGGGIHFQGGSTTGVNLANTLLVDNVNATGSPQDIYCASGTQLGARTHTMIGHIASCTFASFSGIPPNSDARLSPLFDFGSGIPTHALMPGSAALDAGNPTTTNALTRCLTSDARSVARPPSCDLGAYEEKFDVTVNSFSDLPDLNPGDGVCLALGNVCTLRAVAQEGSASRGRWFVKLPVGTYTLNRAFNPNIDADGGDLDVKLLSHEPFQMTLYGTGDANDVQIVSAGFDRVLEVRGSQVNVPAYENIDYPIAFALLNATARGGDLNEDPFESDPNAPLGGGGIKVIGAKSLFYNVVVRNNYVEAIPATENSVGGGMYVSVRSLDNSPARPYGASIHLERFAVVDNATSQVNGGQNKYAGGMFVDGATPYEISDSITMINGTIAGNASVHGGGVMMFNAVAASFLSIVNNIAGPQNPPGFWQYGAGLTVGAQNNTLRNTLVAGNMAGSENSDCEISGIGSSVVSLGYNLIGTVGAGCVISGDTSTNLINVAPWFGTRVVSPSGMPLYPLLAASPAGNVIPLAACADGEGYGVLSDAAAGSRPGKGDSTCSIGAAEEEPSLFADDFE